MWSSVVTGKNAFFHTHASTQCLNNMIRVFPLVHWPRVRPEVSLVIPKHSNPLRAIAEAEHAVATTLIVLCSSGRHRDTEWATTAITMNLNTERVNQKSWRRASSKEDTTARCRREKETEKRERTEQDRTPWTHRRNSVHSATWICPCRCAVRRDTSPRGASRPPTPSPPPRHADRPRSCRSTRTPRRWPPLHRTQWAQHSLATHPSIHLSIHPSIHSPVCPSIHLFI